MKATIPPMLFCYTGWMKRYAGAGEGDPLLGGGKFNELHPNQGFEQWNFQSLRGKMHGYVRVRNNGDVAIDDHFGAGKHDESISGVTVVWAAPKDGTGTTVVVGWYRNATVYRQAKQLTRGKRKIVINFEAQSGDATLLLPEDRGGLVVPRSRKIKGGMGQSCLWYADNPAGKKFCKKVLAFIDEPQFAVPDIDIHVSGVEGQRKLVTHFRVERDASLANKKKEAVLAKTGKLACEVCGFDFHKKYGHRGKDFCEVHHKKKLSSAERPVTTELSDLAIVCSNCHRMIHRGKSMLTLGQLRALLR